MLCVFRKSCLSRAVEKVKLSSLVTVTRSATGKTESDDEDNASEENRISQTPTQPTPTMGQNPEAFIRQKDEMQRQYLQKQAGVVKEMPPDLREFINRSPVIVEEMSTQPVTPRLPRYMRDEEDDKKKSGRPDFSDGRIQERLPLMEKIQGFDTLRTTNFSRTEVKTPVRTYQMGDPVDIYDLLNRRDNGEDDEDSLVETVYAEYAKQFKLPDEEHQIRHKKMLKNTLRYLRIPVLLRDPQGGPFDAVSRERVKDFEMFHRSEVVPKTTAKYVLEDLLDNRAPRK